MEIDVTRKVGIQAPEATRLEGGPDRAYEEKNNDVFGDCVIEKPLGQGGAASVYKARHRTLEVFRALKVLKAEHAGSREWRGRFLREAKISAALDHAGIVRIHAVGEERGKPYIEMEFIDGASLRHWLMVRGALPAGPALAIAEQVAGALAYAHSAPLPGQGGHGLVHRDIKPENLLLCADGRVKLVDFGIAKGAGHAGDTQAGTVLGTCRYMPPEQIDGRELDGRADVYALAAVLYEVLAGVPAFGGESTSEVFKNVASRRLTPLRRMVKGLPPGAADAVEKGMRPDRESRYADAATFAQALGALRKKYGHDARALVRDWLEGKADASARPLRLRGPVRVAMVLAALAGIAGVAWFLLGPSAPLRTAPAVPAVKFEPARPLPAPVPADAQVKVIAPPPEARPAAAPSTAVRTLPKNKSAMNVPSQSVPPKTQEASVPSAAVIPGVLDKGRRFFENGDYDAAESALRAVVADPSETVRAEAEFYILKCRDARFRAGNGSLKASLRSGWQDFIRRYGKSEACAARVKEAKQRLLFVIGS